MIHFIYYYCYFLSLSTFVLRDLRHLPFFLNNSQEKRPVECGSYLGKNEFVHSNYLQYLPG